MKRKVKTKTESFIIFWSILRKMKRKRMKFLMGIVFAFAFGVAAYLLLNAYAVMSTKSCLHSLEEAEKDV